MDFSVFLNILGSKVPYNKNKLSTCRVQQPLACFFPRFHQQQLSLPSLLPQQRRRFLGSQKEGPVAAVVVVYRFGFRPIHQPVGGINKIFYVFNTFFLGSCELS